MTKIAINGFGRIGRCVMRLLAQHPELELSETADPHLVESVGA